jgi:hypothetical protein
MLVGRTTTTLQRHLAELHLNRVQLCCCAGEKAFRRFGFLVRSRGAKVDLRWRKVKPQQRSRICVETTADLRRKHRGVRSGGGCGPAEDAVRRKVRSGAGCEAAAGVERPSVRSGAGCGACQSEDAVEEEERTRASLGFPSCCEVRNASVARLTACDGERSASVRQVNTDRCEATFARMLKLNRRRTIKRGAP